MVDFPDADGPSNATLSGACLDALLCVFIACVCVAIVVLQCL